jgi:vacuolar-type H+-ATPase subunit E/Vma4
MDITNEARKHLLNFLKKVLDGSYTQNESENFSILKYQNNDLEKIREEVSKMILQVPGADFSNKVPLGENDRALVEELACELEKQCT